MQNTVFRPGRGGHAPGLAYAKGAGARTNHGVGISATARTRIASGRPAAGRRRDAKPDIASTPRPEPGMPRRKKNTDIERSLRLRPWRAQKLRRRVVTQQKILDLLEIVWVA